MTYALIAVRQTATVVNSAEDATVTISLSSAVSAGSTLVLIGSAYNGATSQASLLNSVSDGTNTWGTPTNVRSAGSYTPNAFSCVAEDVDGGTFTVTATFSATSSNNVSMALIEVEKCVTASGVDKTVTGTGPGTPNTATSIGPSSALTQTDNLVIGCVGGWFGIVSAPAGYTAVLTQNNGANCGCQVSYKSISSTDALTLTVNHEGTGGATSGIMLVIKAATAGAALRYRFNLDPDTFTSADTGITAYVWRNSGPDGVVAEKYTSLSGDATAGQLLITSGLPSSLSASDTITGVVSNSTDTSGIISGTVEEA